jgi:hypothetical protein
MCHLLERRIMDHHIKDYYREFCDDTPRGNFHKVLPIDENSDLNWSDVQQLVPHLCKGWYELSKLNSKDRIDFVRDFWRSKLPYHPSLDEFLIKFFDSLDDILFFLIQQKFDDAYEANLVYSLKNDDGFFRGLPAATDEDVSYLKQTFTEFTFPYDYTAFLQIHNGFSKATDTTGIIPIKQLPTAYLDFQTLVLEEDVLATKQGVAIDPKKILPFYESFGMPFYQCFWADWYPENEMGNVYYSDLTKTISDVNCKDPSSDSMAFPTFLDWLMFYLERIG